MRSKELRELSLQDLNFHARKLGIVGAPLMSKDELIKNIIEYEENPDKETPVEGILERLPDGFGFLRSARYDYISSPDDIYVSPSQIRRFNLRTGDMISGVIRKPKESEKYFALLKINKVNQQDPALLLDRTHFDRL